MADDLSGQTLKGYEIGERIGTGSFGAVYRATQPTIGREVAIKVILPNYANHPDFVRRFESEARLVARLEHPYIVPLFDYWREPDCAYLVMRLLPGSLRLLLQQSGPLTGEDAVSLVDQVAAALAMSHRQGVVHRDIKPDNILLDHEGNAYLSDFGLAEVVQAGLEDHDDTVSGSPAYMAPEQLKSEPVTPQSDIYALGIVLFEMLTATHPFADLNISDLIKYQLLEPLPSVRTLRADLPEAVDYVLQRATAKDPAQRYSDALVLAADLRGALLGERTFIPAAAEDEIIENPYKGLRPFEEADSSDFFGRENLVARLVTSLGDDHELARFLAVVGPSGSGKSSLIHAGLVPALRRGALPGSDQWYVITLVPSAHPLTDLETFLLSVATRPVEGLRESLQTDPRGLVTAASQVLHGTVPDLLLIVDQFEELFTLVAEESERAQFLALLVQAVVDPDSRVRVIITLRADFYDRPLLYESFGELMQARTHTVLPLNESELERAVVAPAERAGVEIEPNLVAAILNDVREEPGALPLMQYALTEVFERRQERVMTLAGYEDINRAAGALARRAERVFERMTPEQQAITRQVFLRLVTLGEGTDDIRRRARRAELLATVRETEPLEEVLDIFGRHRLLSFDREPTTREPTVEVAHEALLREWGRLRDWLDDSREDVRQQRRLAGLAAEWQRSGQDPSFLMRGTQLEHVKFWLDNTLIALTGAEREYVDASIIVREKQSAAEAARRAREAGLEARARRFQRRLASVMFVAMVIAITLSFIAFQQRQEARDAREDAEESAKLAQTQAASAATAAAVAGERADELQSLALVADAERAVDDNDFDLALALALEANLIPNAPIDAQRLLDELAPTAASRIFRGHTAPVGALAISPDGAQVLSGADDGSLILWDTATAHALHTWTGHNGRVRGLVFLPDGDHALSAGDDDTLVLWDVTTTQPVRTFIGHDDDVFAVALSPDGTQALSGSRDQTVILWDIETGTPIRRLGEVGPGHDQRITCVAFSPDGTLAASGSADNALIVWDLASGDILARLEQHRDTVTDVVFSPDGSSLLSASVDNTVIVWDVASGTAINRLEDHSERVSSLAISPDGRQVVSGAGNQFAGASTDNSLILWNLFLGQPVRRYVGHSLFVSDVVFSPDGSFIVSASADGTLRLWSADYDLELARVAADTATSAAAFDPIRSRAWVALDDGRLFRQNLSSTDSETPATAAVTEFSDQAHQGAITALAVSADGSRLLTASEDRTVRLWDTATRAAIATLTGHTNTVNAVAFSPDGALALSGSRDRSAILWDLASGERLRTFPARHTNEILAVAFSPDGALALTASADHTLILWDVATGEEIRFLRGHTDAVTSVVFSPDGTRALSGSADKSLILWDVASGGVIRQFGITGTGHTDRVTAVAFSPDGTRALSGSRDRSAILWDLDTGAVIRRDQGHGDTVLALAFSPDAALAYSAGAGGDTRLWPTAKEVFVSWVQANRYVRELTCEERDRYRLEPCAPPAGQ